MTLTTLQKRIAFTLSVIALLTALSTGFATIHAQYAKAEDVQSLAAVIKSQELRRIEETLNQIEQEIAVLAAKPNKDQADTIRLTQLEQTRARLLQDKSDLKASQ